MTLGYVTHVLAIRAVCGWLVGAGSFVCWLALALCFEAYLDIGCDFAVQMVGARRAPGRLSEVCWTRQLMRESVMTRAVLIEGFSSLLGRRSVLRRVARSTTSSGGQLRWEPRFVGIAGGWAVARVWCTSQLCSQHA